MTPFQNSYVHLYFSLTKQNSKKCLQGRKESWRTLDDVENEETNLQEMIMFRVILVPVITLMIKMAKKMFMIRVNLLNIFEVGDKM